ncbi:MAG: replicative DNA helicase [Flavobacteriales bacterium]|nr:replicative DNA helicase [Flavobacteriales bacterium]MCX7767828.1 replicative DNA helicase [Flavobacteriales bacterium]MDW8409771.1 replicative DNA helicase [Flavobacteriales bacterium]
MAPRRRSMMAEVRPGTVREDLLPFGKVPPHSEELEIMVLGAILLEKHALGLVMEIVNEDTFYNDRHKAIFKACKDLFVAAQPVDIVTVTEKLREQGQLDFVGGPFYVASLTARVGSSANVEYHARLLQEKFIKRDLIRISGQIIEKAFDDSTDAFDVFGFAQEELMAIIEKSVKRGVLSIDRILNQVVGEIYAATHKKDGITGVPSGYASLDRITGGWQRSDMIVLAARPSVGKTAFALNLARNAAVSFNLPVAVFSLEMSNSQLVQRLLSMETGLSMDSFRKGALTREHLEILSEKVAILEKAPLFIDDTPGLDISEFATKARKLKMQHDIQMIVVDYLQLMRAPQEHSGTREQVVASVSRTIKLVAKELNIPIIALAQLNRAIETRGKDKRPELSDLRESGAIEQDADVVAFLSRFDASHLDSSDQPYPEDMVQLSIKKHRNGPLGEVEFKFLKGVGRFLDYYETQTQYTTTPDGNIIKTVSSRMNRDFGLGSEEAPF